MSSSKTRSRSDLMPHRNGRIGNRALLAPQAVRLRAAGATAREIAEALGVSRSYAADLYLDPSGEKAKTRKQSYGQPCMDCGAPTSGYEGHKKEPRCVRCANIKNGLGKTKWPRERIIEAIRWWNSEYGEPPASTDWNAHTARHQLHDEPRAVRFEELFAAGTVPWFNSVVRRFGSFNNAIRAAGFEPRPSYGGSGNERRRSNYGKAKPNLGAHRIYWHTTGGRTKIMHALVLRRNGDGWVEVGETEARSYQDAVENLATEPGDYLAVPTAQVFAVAKVEKLAATPKAS